MVYIKVLNGFTESSALELKTATNIADECSTKANKVFLDNQHTIKYASRKSVVHTSRAAFGDEEVSNADLSYLDLLLGNTQEQEKNIPFQDRLIAEQQRLAQQAI